jgi:hypothetical protein
MQIFHCQIHDTCLTFSCCLCYSRVGDALRDNRESGHHNQQRHHYLDLIRATDMKPNIFLRTGALTAGKSAYRELQLVTNRELTPLTLI